MKSQLAPSQETTAPAPASVEIEQLPVTWRYLWSLGGPWVVTIANLSLFFTAWEVLARTGRVNALILPRFSEVMSALWTGVAGTGITTSTFVNPLRDGIISEAIVASGRTFVVAMAIAVVIGVPFGLLLGSSRWLDIIASPYVWAMQALPRIALIPLLLIALGFTERMVITVIVLSAVFPIIVNSWAGVKTTDRNLMHAARMFGANRRQLQMKVVLPSTVPFIIVGIQQGLTRGFVGLIVGELFGASQGLGFLLIRSGQAFATDLMYAVLLTIVTFALVLVQGARWLEGRLTPWANGRG